MLPRGSKGDRSYLRAFQRLHKPTQGPPNDYIGLHKGNINYL
jgi:hypothetical protein